MRVLLVEGDAPVAQSVETMLKSNSFNVYSTDLGEEGVNLVNLYDYDIVLLGDVRDMTTADMMRSIRAAKVKVPTMILSGIRNVDSIVHALDVGADDYMTKPFHEGELVARINAIVRRSKGHATSKITVGDIVVNLDTKIVTVTGRQVSIAGKELQILELLMLRRGVFVSKETIMDHLYGGMDEPDPKILEVYICKLRKKLPADAIKTVWGLGYRLDSTDGKKW